MRTAVLSRFTALLCDAVTGTANARDIIDKLERENLFLISLDDKREWFRYHHLFAQLLLGQLDRAEPGAIAALHQRASAWYLERDQPTRPSVTYWRLATSPGRPPSSRSTGTATWTQAGWLPCVAGFARSAMTTLSTSPLAAHSTVKTPHPCCLPQARRLDPARRGATGPRARHHPEAGMQRPIALCGWALRTGQPTPAGRPGASPTGGRPGYVSPARGDTGRAGRL